MSEFALEPGHRKQESRQEGKKRRQEADRKKILATVRQIHQMDRERLRKARKTIENALPNYEEIPL